MLNSAQVESLKRRLSAGESVAAHEGLPVARVDASRRDEGEWVASEAAVQVAMPAPEFVLGQPEDASCLVGVSACDLRVPEKRIRRFANVQVVGWRSIATRDGFFSSAQNYVEGDADAFFATPHEGFAASGRRLHCVSSASPRLVMGGDTLFLSGLEAGNYGSFLFRFLPKLLLFCEMGLAVDHVVVPDKSSFVSQAIAWAGLDCTRLISVREAAGIVFERVYMIDDFEAEGALCASTRDRFARRVGERDPRRAIYVSRYLSHGYRPGYRPLRNELELQRAMARRGLEVVYPELLGFHQQVALFSQARLLVGPSGSGMLNAIFAAAGSRVLDLESYTTTVRQHAKIYGTCGLRYGFCFGNYADAPGPPGFLRAWTVEIEQVQAGVERLMAS